MLVWYVAEIGQNSWIPNVNREDKQALINFTILTSPVRRRRADKYFLALNKMFNVLTFILPQISLQHYVGSHKHLSCSIVICVHLN